MPSPLTWFLIAGAIFVVWVALSAIFQELTDPKHWGKPLGVAGSAIISAAALENALQKQKKHGAKKAAFNWFVFLGAFLTFWGVWASFFTDIWEYFHGSFPW